MDDVLQISDSHRKFFEAKGEKLHCPKGQISSWSSDKQIWAYFLSSGHIKTFVSYADGSEKTLGYLSPGSTFSQASSAFNHGGRGEMEFFATQDCVLYRVSLMDFLTEMQTNQTFSNDFLMMQLRDEMMMVDHIVLLGEHDLDRRFNLWLLMMGKFYGATTDDSVAVNPPLTHNEVASWLGVRRETAGKLMRKSIDGGYISLKLKKLTISSLVQIEKLL